MGGSCHLREGPHESTHSTRTMSPLFGLRFLLNYGFPMGNWLEFVAILTGDTAVNAPVTLCTPRIIRVAGIPTTAYSICLHGIRPTCRATPSGFPSRHRVQSLQSPHTSTKSRSAYSGSSGHSTSGAMGGQTTRCGGSNSGCLDVHPPTAIK